MGQTGKTLIGTVGKSVVKEVAQDALVGAASSKAGSLVMDVTGDANLSRLAGLGTGILSGSQTGKALNSIDSSVSSSVKTINHIDDVADVSKIVDDVTSTTTTKTLYNSTDVSNTNDSATLSLSEAEEYAFNAIKGRNKSDAVMLGKYEQNMPTSYDEMAKTYDCQYFNLENYDELASQYPREEIWKINEKFLDIQTSSGREIYLSHDPDMFRNTPTFYAKEIEYLEQNGYTIVKEGDLWHAIR